MVATADVGFAPRVVSVGRGRRLVVRSVEERDVDGLLALFGRLDAEDRHLRFFSSFHPDRDFVLGMTRVGERGVALVAVVEGAVGGEEVVGEASFAMLPNGDAEFALTVDRAWRGWLGPFLLDVLVSVAVERGIPNLEADVLAANHAMLALARSRGYVTMDHPDWTMIRLVIGAASPVPGWPGVRIAPRLLVEGGGGRWHAEDEARAAGLHVVVCPGPGPGRPPCPALAGQPCPLAAGADAIVVAHPPDDGDWSALMAAHTVVHPGVPVCVDARSHTGTVIAGRPLNTGSRGLDAFLRRLTGARGSVTASTGSAG